MSSSDLSLPDELVERILLEAWRTLSSVPDQSAKKRSELFSSSSRYRFAFCASVARTSRAFRRIVRDLPFQCAVFRAKSDLFFYQYVVRRSLLQAKMRGEDTETAHRTLFMRTEVVLAWEGNITNPRDSAYPSSGPYTPIESAQPLFPDAARIVVERWGLVPELAEWIRKLPSLASVRIGESETSHMNTRRLQREMDLPEMKLLQRLRGINSDSPALQAMTEIEGPASGFALLSHRFNVGPVTMLTKQSLKNASDFLPGLLTTLVLDTPPGLDGVSDVSGWDIPGGLRAGLIALGVKRTLEQPTITVRGAMNVEPISWQLAMNACTDKGVVLKLDVVF